MRTLILALALSAAVSPQIALAEDGMPGLPPDDGSGSGEMQQGMDLMQQGMQSVLNGLVLQMQPHLQEMGAAIDKMKPVLIQLMTLMQNVDQYEAPVMLENGDILIRRKPAPPDAPQQEPEAGSDIDL